MLVLVRGKLSMGDTWHVGRLPDISKYESGECCLPPLGELTFSGASDDQLVTCVHSAAH